MLWTLLLALLGLGAPAEKASALYVRVEVAPTKARLGDVLFVRVSLKNRGDTAVLAPETCWPQLELEDPVEDTRYSFVSSPVGCGSPPKHVLLQAGQTRIVGGGVIRLPRLDRIHFRFWNPKSWAPREYSLIAHCAGTVGFSELDISIRRRPNKEMAALLEFYDGGYHAPVPPGWDTYRPTLGIFGLLSFPMVCSVPDELAAIEAKLSPGSLREIVHATRLTAELYDAETLTEKRKATRELLRWLDKRPEIQRHIMASSLVSWATQNKGLGGYLFEFVDQVIPRLPENSQQGCRKSNDDARQYYLKYLNARKQSNSQPKAPQPEMRYTADQIRLMGRIIQYGGRAWFPDEVGFRSSGWKSSRGEPGFRVWLARQGIRVIPLTKLREFGNVEWLTLEGPKVTDAILRPLKTLPGLRHLELRDTRVTHAGLQYLQDLHQLEGFYARQDLLAPPEISDAGLRHLAGLKRLEHLQLSSPQMTDRGLEHLSGLTGLLELNLSRTKITSEGVKCIASLRQLRTLSLYGTQVDDKALEYLQGLTQLRSLHLEYTHISDQGLAQVASFTDLEELGLSGDETLTDAGLEHLKPLTRLRYLTLHGCVRITDEGVEHLEGLTELRLLALSGTEITDAGLRHFEGMKKLQSLAVSGTKVTKEGIARLKQILPDAIIR